MPFFPNSALVAAMVSFCFLLSGCAKTTSPTNSYALAASTKITKSKPVRLKKHTSAFVGSSGHRISKKAPWKCVPNRLKKVIVQVTKKFGPVVINSTHRSRSKNRRVGGKRKSYHLGCRALDFRVKGRTRGLTRWLARHPLVGGYKRYPAGFYHIDIGPKRTW